MANNKRGHFIVFEGTDGCGKKTQVKLLRKTLQILGYPHQVIEFPRYTGNPYGKLIASYLKGELGEINENNTYLVSLAYAGDRFLAKSQINQWLKEGNLVIADRYVPSSKAYMSARLPLQLREEFIDWLDDLEYNINSIPREELVLYLHVKPDISQTNALKRKKREYLADNKKEDIHEKNSSLQRTSGEIYLQLAKQESNWAIIECMESNSLKSPEEIHKEIVQVLKEKGILKIKKVL